MDCNISVMFTKAFICRRALISALDRSDCRYLEIDQDNLTWGNRRLGYVMKINLNYLLVTMLRVTFIIKSLNNY